VKGDSSKIKGQSSKLKTQRWEGKEDRSQELKTGLGGRGIIKLKAESSRLIAEWLPSERIAVTTTFATTNFQI